MKNGNEPATPVRISERHENRQTGQVTVVETESFQGLTKREHFAGLAMQGIINKFAFVKGQEDDIAEISVMVADALLAELEK